MTTGTIEEKIYQRQISKQGLCEGTVDPKSNKSIKLSKEELKELFFPCEEKDIKDCLTHDSLSCDCTGQGEIPAPDNGGEEEEEDDGDDENKSCRIYKTIKSALKISELFHWEHHGNPFDSDFLNRLCLEKSKQRISYIFHNRKI